MKKNEIFEKKISCNVVVAALKEVTGYVLEASEKELKALAKRFGVEKIHFLKVYLCIVPNDIIRITGKLEALTCRECVISLEKFDEKMEEKFEVFYAENPSSETGEIIDPIINGRIRLGDLVAEQYGLALNPFPKKPGVKNLYGENQEKKQTPFSDLKKILEK